MTNCHSNLFRRLQHKFLRAYSPIVVYVNLRLHCPWKTSFQSPNCLLHCSLISAFTHYLPVSTPEIILFNFPILKFCFPLLLFQSQLCAFNFNFPKILLTCSYKTAYENVPIQSTARVLRVPFRRFQIPFLAGCQSLCMQRRYSYAPKADCCRLFVSLRK